MAAAQPAAAAPAAAPPPANAEPACKCDKDSIPTILLIMGLVANGLMIAAAVLQLMLLDGGVRGFILDIYIMILGLLGIAAELRLVRFVRGFVYPIVKYVYFVASYRGRALYYFFLATININTEPVVMLIAAIVMMLCALMIFFASLYWGLPDLDDPKHAKQAEFERRIVSVAAASASSTPASGSGGGYVPPKA